MHIKNLDEKEFWKDYELTRQEVEIAIECFYTWLEINKLASANEKTYKALNKNPTFWNISLYGLQCSFFIVLGRIFDDGHDAHSIHKLITSCLANPQFFSKEALAKRKQEDRKKPEWLDEYIENAHEPSMEELRNLNRALSHHRKRFDEIYRNIRNYVFAHRVAKKAEIVSELFGKTKIGDIENILYFLYDLLEVIWQLYHNGRAPVLGVGEYDYKVRISGIVRSVLSVLPNKNTNA